MDEEEWVNVAGTTKHPGRLVRPTIRVALMEKNKDSKNPE